MNYKESKYNIEQIYIGSGYSKDHLIKYLKQISEKGYNESYDGSMIMVRFDWGYIVVSPTCIEYLEELKL